MFSFKKTYICSIFLKKDHYDDDYLLFLLSFGEYGEDHCDSLKKLFVVMKLVKFIKVILV